MHRSVFPTLRRRPLRISPTHPFKVFWKWPARGNSVVGMADGATRGESRIGGLCHARPSQRARWGGPWGNKFSDARGWAWLFPTCASSASRAWHAKFTHRRLNFAVHCGAEGHKGGESVQERGAGAVRLLRRLLKALYTSLRREEDFARRAGHHPIASAHRRRLEALGSAGGGVEPGVCGDHVAVRSRR
jgi:hypothetical protein